MVEIADSATASKETFAGRQAVLTRILQGLVLIVLAAAAGLYVANLALAAQWAQTPFLGGFVEHSLIFNDINAEGQSVWPAFAAGVQPGDQIVAVEGAAVSRQPALSEQLRKFSPGDTVNLTVRRAGGQQVTVPVGLTRFATVDLVNFYVTPNFIGLIYLGIGLWVYWLRRGEVTGRNFALFCAMTAIALGGLFDLFTTHVFTWVWTLAVAATAATLVNLSLVFPQEAWFVRKWPLFRLAGFVPMLALAGYALYTLYAPGLDPNVYATGWRYLYVFLGGSSLFFVGMMAYRWRYSRSPITREQSRVTFIGALAALALMAYWLVTPLFTRAAVPFWPNLYLPPLVLFPAAAAYAILRYRLLDTDRALGQAMVYAAMSVLALAAYGLILTGASLIVGTTLSASNPVVLGLVVFVLVAAFNPVRDRLQQLVDTTFFRGSRSFAQRAEAFGRALTRAAGLGDIAAALGEHIEGGLKPAHFHLFLRSAAGDEFTAYGDGELAAKTDIRFTATGALATALNQARTALLLTADQPLSENLTRDRTRLAVLGSALYVPLPGKTGLSGWLAIGPKLTGEPFNRDDVRFAESLADQSSLAIERATVISDLERRVRELNVLSQMSQAVNFTVAYDDLLELIYAQTSKVVDTRNFFIVLKDARGTSFSYAFYVENNERINEEENRPWSATRGLAVEIARTGQPILTDDYHSECRRRNVAPQPRQYKAWLGVPLNAGAETIGIMSVASFDSQVTFTQEQVKIVGAIADQAASAIVKARLYQQTEQRARQLATLNEVNTSMSSTLELDPLLERIIQSSANILDCEAGSLFLTDDETGEYVFRVAVGPVGDDLVGMRIAPGKGFVGEAIEASTALIVNDVQSDPRWFKGADQESGFATKALMVIPLRFQDRPIGAVEVINKRDGSDFDEEDQSLLTAFAGPAAVAIQNARLFTMTDEALADRVEELSVMQRIDRELNMALDVKRVMGITLGWAMKNTDATAGVVGITGDTGLTIIATEGADEALAALDGQVLPLDHGRIGQVARTGETSLVRELGADGQAPGLLKTTRAQLILPISSEQQMMGVIILESPEAEAFDEEEVAFVVRLVDHASIAITNARLYAEVHAANIAKSEFVSFVAHELKTPMTSIKGYSDLLLGGAVGPVNDMQKQFLGTIRSNVERMSTLVSDLADVARIESGRLRLEPQAIAFQAIIDDVVRTTQAMIDGKQQTLIQELEPRLPNIWADHTRTAQVLTNVVSNAHKYTPEGGQIILRVAREDNTWDPDGAPEVLLVSVRDNGIGIAPEDQQKLFQKFFRAEDRMAREMAPGTGLGLNIVKNLVELQGGKIWFESEFRKGTTFYFTVPIATEEAVAKA